jgi:outer membrane biosynthesis protein TonB
MRDRPVGALFLITVAFLSTISQSNVAQAQASTDATMPRIYSASEVDTHARQIEGGTQPLYPDSLRPLGIDGKVLAQFVVDTTGLVDTTSILTEAYGQPLFAASVRQALATMRFTVAQKSGHKVAEEIEESFLFHKEDPAPVAQSNPVSTLVDSMMRAGDGYKYIGGSAEFASGSPAPAYPVALIRAGLAAIVYTTFVIDTTGRIDPKTFRVTSVKTWRVGAAPFHDSMQNPDIDDVAPEQAFTQAVVAQVPNMRFIPAQSNGRKTRQLVKFPFTFTLVP